MGYLTNLLLFSAGLLLVSGSPAPKGYQGYLASTNNKEGKIRRRYDHKGNDYSAQGEDYFVDGLSGLMSRLVPKLVDVARDVLPEFLPLLLGDGEANVKNQKDRDGTNEEDPKDGGEANEEDLKGRSEEERRHDTARRN